MTVIRIGSKRTVGMCFEFFIEVSQKTELKCFLTSMKNENIF